MIAWQGAENDIMDPNTKYDAQPNPDSIPPELKNLDQWVCWRLEKRKGKPTKVPIDPKTGRYAESDNSETWSSFPTALSFFEEHKNNNCRGLGVVLTDQDPVTGVDLDHCRNSDTGTIDSWAWEIINALKSYTEISPSDDGIRIFVQGKPPEKGRKKGNIEIYFSKRYFTVTGHHLDGTPIAIENRQKELEDLFSNMFAGPSKPKNPNPINPRNLNDQDLIQKARIAANGAKFTRLWEGDWGGYPSQSEAELALCSILAFWTNNAPARIDQMFRQSGLMREKWDERHYGDGRTYGEAVTSKAIEYTTKTYESKKRIEDKADPPSGLNEGYIHVGINLTDLGNARRLVAAHGMDLRYCHPWGRWLYWDGRRWKNDDIGEIYRRAKNTIGLLYKEALEESDGDRRKALAAHALRCESDSKIRAMIELTKSEPGIPILPNELDRNDWVLNVLNGTIDLATGELRPHLRGDSLTKLAPVEFTSDLHCSFWTEHLNKIMAGNEDLIKFLQRAYGHCLTGVTDERAMLIQYGMGGNGKTTSNEVVSLVLGDYAVRTSTETLLVKRYGAIPNDVAKLKGARFVYSSEAEEGKRLSESLIKDLTGGDTIAARFMRGEWFTFRPTFKIWLATNHKPIIRGTDKAIWDRIRLVPYTVTIPDEERIPLREMMAHFMDELPGILSWMVQGCLQWARRGLGMPHEVKEATGRYREEMDVIGEFINECCKTSPEGKATANALYDRYLNWCEKRDEKPMSQKQFGRTLGERGFRSERVTRGPDKGKYRWEGISLVRC